MKKVNVGDLVKVNMSVGKVEITYVGTVSELLSTQFVLDNITHKVRGKEAKFEEGNRRIFKNNDDWVKL